MNLFLIYKVLRAYGYVASKKASKFIELIKNWKYLKKKNNQANDESIIIAPASNGTVENDEHKQDSVIIYRVVDSMVDGEFARTESMKRRKNRI